MIIAPHLVPTWLSATTGTAMLACLIWAAATANWRALRAGTERQHALLGGMLALWLLWLLTFEVVEGVWIHLLGVTSLTLIVGWHFAVLGATLSLLGHVWSQQHGLPGVPLAWLFSVFIPATSTRLLAGLLRRHGSRNLFVYMLGAGFGGGLLGVVLVALAALPTFWLIGQPGLAASALRNWTFLMLLMFPEGFVNGMVVTAFSVFYPDVVKTLDDDFYLGDDS